MLSRLASRGGSSGLLRCVSQQVTCTSQAATTPAKTDTSKRDLINFPDLRQPESSPPVRHGIFPEAWFQAFYKKTGVTGPYVFAISFGSFLVGKEYYVVEHEFTTGVALALLIYTIHTKFGLQIKDWIHKETEKERDELDSAQKEQIQALKDLITGSEKAIWHNEGGVLLFDAKRENVLLQQEAAYRARLLDAYKEVKRRLDYQIEKQNVERRIAQKNLVDWVIRNVLASITADQEKNTLKQCISDLNTLAARA